MVFGQYDKFGENNPRWKGGKSAGYIRKLAINAVLKSGRHIDICEHCGKLETKINFIDIHHIDRNRKNNNPENLIVLCRNCHRLLHANEEKNIINCEICKKEIVGSKIRRKKILCRYCRGRIYNGLDPINKRICVICKKEFIVKSTKKYCSIECKKISDSNRLRYKKKIYSLQICPYCEKEFMPKSNHQIFCNISCGTLYRVFKTTKKERYTLKICPYCEKEFMPKSNHQIFCSTNCTNYFHRFNMTKKERYIIKKCLYCEKEFIPKLFDKQIFCSKKCNQTFRNKKHMEMNQNAKKTN